MPTYEYACDACGHEFEREQRITDKPVKKCPECGKMKARRMIGGGNFILKGGGWYSDLYSGPSNKKGGDAAPSAESSSSESKADKPAKADKAAKADKKKAKASTD